MNEHDIIEQSECSVTCRCGAVIVASSLHQARKKHDAHFGIELVRAALEAARG